MWLLFLCKKTARRSDGAKGPDLIGRESQRECIGQSRYPYAFAENVAGMATYGEGRDDTILRQKHLWQRREKGMKKRRLLSVVLMMVAMLVMSLNAQAAIKLNKSKLTLKIGKTFTVKVSGTTEAAEWSSSKKSVVEITKTGKKNAKIKANKAGKATITAKVNGKKYKCVVKVPKTAKAKVYSFMSTKTYVNTKVMAMSVYNGSNKAITIHQEGCYLQPDYSRYDRLLKLMNTNSKVIKKLKIAPKTEKTFLFRVLGD